MLATWNAGPQIEAYFFRTFAGVDRAGNIRSTDPDLDSINLTRRQMGSGVYHESAFAGRDMIENAAFHREAFRPAGMNHVVGMTTRLAVGEAVFAMGYASGDAPAMTGGQTEIILNLLLPAFARAFETLDRQARNFERLQHAIAESDMEVSLRDGDQGSGGDSGAFLNLPLPGRRPVILPYRHRTQRRWRHDWQILTALQNVKRTSRSFYWMVFRPGTQPPGWASASIRPGAIARRSSIGPAPVGVAS